MPCPRPPIAFDRVVDDPEQVRRLVARHAPYLPVQRYFQNDAEFKASSGQDRVFVAPVFRGDWAYDTPLVDGVDGLLHHEGFCRAARDLFECEVVRPQQLYVNLTWQLPFAQGVGHTDVPAFRGVDRTRYPTQLLSTMGHSGLFESHRVRIATAVAWFYRGRDGGFEYWPDRIDVPPRVHEGDIDNTAILGDNDFMYHRVRATGEPKAGLPRDMTLSTRLERVEADAWRLLRPGDREAGEADRTLATMRFEDIRISLSWKASCFADEEEARCYDEHLDDLDIEAVWRTFYADLEERGERFERPRAPSTDPKLAELLGRVYVATPSVFA